MFYTVTNIIGYSIKLSPQWWTQHQWWIGMSLYPAFIAIVSKERKSETLSVWSMRTIVRSLWKSFIWYSLMGYLMCVLIQRVFIFCEIWDTTEFVLGGIRTHNLLIFWLTTKSSYLGARQEALSKGTLIHWSHAVVLPSHDLFPKIPITLQIQSVTNQHLEVVVRSLTQIVSSWWKSPHGCLQLPHSHCKLWIKSLIK